MPRSSRADRPRLQLAKQSGAIWSWTRSVGPSHVPPQPFRELRSLSRQRRTLVGQRFTVRNRVQKIVDRAGVRIGGILSDVFTTAIPARGMRRDPRRAARTSHPPRIGRPC